MKKRFSLLVTLGFILIGCTQSYTETCLYRSDGSLKPQVALLPVMNHSNDQLCDWDLSKEFTEEIRKRFLFSPKIYPVAFTLDAKRTQDISYSLPDMIPGYVKKENFGADFVVVSELVKHQVLEKAEPVLSMIVRIKMISLQQDHPQVVLQELITSEYPLAQENFGKTLPKWGTKEFDKTPFALAHRKVFREIVTHIEEYTKTVL